MAKRKTKKPLKLSAPEEHQELAAPPAEKELPPPLPAELMLGRGKEREKIADTIAPKAIEPGQGAEFNEENPDNYPAAAGHA
jgi:hypothetical protein